ncbi:CopG family transcriptional regulator [Nostoc sp. DSM 114161]|jgi:hypothetical protein|uniref:hypothetical protein n=1 Tax=Nostoc sp. DSM 114161 TaxID=3440143 RepID=UPI0040456FB9
MSIKKNERIQINLDLSPEIYETITNLSQQINRDNAEVLLKALSLLEVTVEAKQRGKHIWIADENQNLETEITDIEDLSKIIATKGNKPLVLSIGNSRSQEDVELERKVRELKFKQELRKDWIIFIVRDVVFFSAAILFIFAVSGYSLFMQIYR